MEPLETVRAFDIPAVLTKYKDGTLRVVSNEPVVIGTRVQVGVNKEGKPILHTVAEILEERKSKGDFGDKHIPFSYKVKAA